MNSYVGKSHTVSAVRMTEPKGTITGGTIGGAGYMLVTFEDGTELALRDELFGQLYVKAL